MHRIVGSGAYACPMLFADKEEHALHSGELLDRSADLVHPMRRRDARDCPTRFFHVEKRFFHSHDVHRTVGRRCSSGWKKHGAGR